MYAAGISRQFETFGKRDKRIRVAELGVAIAESELAERRAELRRSVRLSLAEAMAGRQKLGAIDSLLQVLRESLRLTEARVAEGDAARLEPTLNVEIGRTRRSVRRWPEVEADLRPAPAGGARPGRAAAPDTMRPLRWTPEPFETKRSGSAPISALRKPERQAEAGMALAEAEAKPDVTISAGYTRQTAGSMTSSGSRPRAARFRCATRTTFFSRHFHPLSASAGISHIEAAAARPRSARLRREHLERTIPLEAAAQPLPGARAFGRMTRRHSIRPKNLRRSGRPTGSVSFGCSTF
jgi:cobalt-zinc-cadmium efflux system outer membrane protein